MKRILLFIFLMIFVLSCEDDSDTPQWVNMYDPQVDQEKLDEACGKAQCGKVEFEGHMMLCGVCEEGEYCNKEQKCESSCEHYNCGTMTVETWAGNENVDCGTCGDKEQCGTNNICISDDDICGVRNCGKVNYTDIDSNIIEIDCGTCSEEEYCSLGQKCELKSSECIGKCGSLKVFTYGGENSDYIECGECEGDLAYCNLSNECDVACIDKDCGTDTVRLDDNSEETFECGSCGDGLNYCDEYYECNVACKNKECGSDTVKLADETDKTFECGSCGEGMNYCDTDNQCQIACQDKECGEETILPFGENEMSMNCGSCGSAEYCDSTLNCAEGSTSGDYVYDTDVVVDTVLGLMWFRSNVQDRTQSEALSACSTSNRAGFTDWQLPDISQLRSIVSGCDKVGTGIDTVTGDDSETCGVTSVCTDSTCSNDNCDGCTNSAGSGPQGLYLAADVWDYTGDANGRFWSSSEVPDKADSYWFIRFSNASVAYNWDGNEYNVICVREIP